MCGYAGRLFYRITPACAGKTLNVSFTVIIWQDHPRVCGENFLLTHMTRRLRGSPPRVRGKLKGFICERDAFRITPACAGKTLTASSNVIFIEDHPRVCGENCFDNANGDENLGSPPRVRGKPVSSPAPMRDGGITPACAGKTPQALRFCHTCQDHPRVCGENGDSHRVLRDSMGSPPRVRGKHFLF